MDIILSMACVAPSRDVITTTPSTALLKLFGRPDMATAYSVCPAVLVLYLFFLMQPAVDALRYSYIMTLQI